MSETRANDRIHRMENYVPALMLAIGLLIGGIAAWLIFRGKGKSERATLEERLAGRESQLQKVQEALDKEVAERERLVQELRAESDRRSAAEQKASRIPLVESQLDVQQDENTVLRSTVSALESKLESEQRTVAEKLDLLRQAREELTAQFKSLASDILDEKSRKFADQNKSSLETLLNPLAEKIRNFEKKVEETYDKESKQRFSL